MVEENQNKITLYYLPSYSPELNLDEYLNNDLKSGIGLKASPKNEKQLKNNVKSHMMHLQKSSLGFYIINQICGCLKSLYLPARLIGQSCFNNNFCGQNALKGR